MMNKTLTKKTYIHVFDKQGGSYRLAVPGYEEGFGHYRNALKYIDDMKQAGTPLPVGASPVNEYDPPPERIPQCSASLAGQANESSLMTIS